MFHLKPLTSSFKENRVHFNFSLFHKKQSFNGLFKPQKHSRSLAHVINLYSISIGAQSFTFLVIDSLDGTCTNVYFLWSYFVTISEFSCMAKLAKPEPVSGPTYLS